MRKKLLIATTNKGKLAEISKFVSDTNIQLISLLDVGITQDIEETGATYEENSQMKAVYYAKCSNLPAIADDGGLEISALNNQPGINSRRWLGYEASDEILLQHLRKISARLPENNRKAWFRTVVSFALPNGNVWSSFGEVEGIIVKNPSKKLLKGYPYRSFFYLPKLKRYYHENELSEEEEKMYNHRRKAIEKLKPVILKVARNKYVRY